MMSKPVTNMLPYALAFIAGLAICLFITLTSGRKEAWDAPAYFTIGIPLMCLVIFALSYWFPQRAWRWALGGATNCHAFSGGLKSRGLNNNVSAFDFYNLGIRLYTQSF